MPDYYPQQRIEDDRNKNSKRKKNIQRDARGSRHEGWELDGQRAAVPDSVPKRSPNRFGSLLARVDRVTPGASNEMDPAYKETRTPQQIEQLRTSFPPQRQDQKNQPMTYGDKLSEALQMVPGLLKGDVQALFQELMSDPKFVAALVASGIAFAALQTTPAGPVIDTAFLVAFGLKSGIEIGQFFYEAYQAKDANDPRLKVAAEKLKSAIENGGAALLSGLAGGFKTLRGLLNKLNGGKQAVKAVQTLGNLSNDAQEAIRLLNLGEKELTKAVELIQRNPKAVDGLLRQILYKMRKADRKGTPFERPQDVAKSLEESLKNYKTITKRDYPFGFSNLQQFQKFEKTLSSALKRYNIPSSDVRIQGSAVHKTTPGDVDVAVVVSDSEFKALGKRFFDFSEKANVRKSILKEIENGKIPSYRFAPGEKPGIGNSVYGEAGELKIQVSLIKRGSEFDVGPYFNIK